MGWDKGRYYTRSRKVNGRVVREYYGCGEVGALAAQLDAVRRQEREHQRELWRIEMEEADAFDETIGKVCQLADIVARAAMVAAGFYCHRGEWRRRRGQKQASSAEFVGEIWLG